MPPVARIEWVAWNPHQIPVLFSVTLARDRRKKKYHSAGLSKVLETIAQWARDYGVAALGVNCGREIGMEEMTQVLNAYRQVTDLPLFARPNAGTPTRVGDGWVYPHTPTKMARGLPELLKTGISMVGGCCGTTPEHIAAFRPIVEEWNSRKEK
jgi:5-methyltetrahydrofolate--homocysteine methyltransferase